MEMMLALMIFVGSPCYSDCVYGNLQNKTLGIQSVTLSFVNTKD